MKAGRPDYIEEHVFKQVIENTPLLSVDLIIRDEGSVLLGKRVNKPASGYWFTLGGRVLKGEMIRDAIERIAEIEIGIRLDQTPRFIGVFEHLYEDAIFEDVATHYLNLGYEVMLSSLDKLPQDQHDEYRWFRLDELMEREDVHPYVKDYFTQKKGTVPQ